MPAWRSVFAYILFRVKRFSETLDPFVQAVEQVTFQVTIDANNKPS